MHSNEIESYKQTLSLTQRQRAILVGVLLGDGHLETSDKRKTYRLKIEHSIKQKEYVDWLYNEFKPWVGKIPQSRVRTYRFPQGTTGEHTAYGFTTYAHGAFRFYGQQFYTKDGKKHIPPLIRKLLTPLSMAVWYLDDGSVKSNRHRTFIIHSHGYTKSDLERVQIVFEQLGIHISLHRQIRATGVYWRIYILSESAEKFFAIMGSIIDGIPSMRYKLGNNLPKE